MSRAVTAALAAVVLWAGVASAQVPSYCEADLVEESDEDELVYQPREGGSYCEGRYVDEVSGSTLTIASVVVGDLMASADAGHVLVDWQPFANGRVRLIVRSLKPRVFYRLDAAPEGSAFGWSMKVAGRLGLSPSDLGYVAVADRPVKDETLYVALRRGDGAVGRRDLRVVVVPDKRVDEIYVTVTTLSRQGEEIVVGDRGSALLWDQNPLAKGFYRAGEPVEIDMPTIDGCDDYHVEIGAALTGGGTANRSFVVHLPDV